jgi:PilZ domain
VPETDLDVDRPDASTQADVTLVSRGITVTACVTRSDEQRLVVSPSGAGRTWHESIKPGDLVEVYWVSGYEERTLPAKVSDVDYTAEPYWHLQPTGPAERSQRRKAVRAKVAVPIVMPWSGGLLRGTTLDLSEGGLKALVDGWGLPPESGSPVRVTLSLENDVTIDLAGEVAWGSDRGTGQWVLAVQFTDVDERAGDTLRRRVFRALREERARGGE